MAELFQAAGPLRYWGSIDCHVFALFNKAISVGVMYASVDLVSVCEVAFQRLHPLSAVTHVYPDFSFFISL